MYWYFYKVQLNRSGMVTIETMYAENAIAGFIVMLDLGFVVLECTNFRDHD